MPFVHRHEELWQVFRVKADHMREILLSQNPIANIRPSRSPYAWLLVSAFAFDLKYFGANTITLGRMFPQHIQDAAVQGFIKVELADISALDDVLCGPSLSEERRDDSTGKAQLEIAEDGFKETQSPTSPVITCIRATKA